LAVSGVVAAVGIPSAAAAPRPSRVLLHGSLTPRSERTHPRGTVAPASRIGFDLVLALRHAAGARALVRAISTPGSAQYRHYLSDAAWVSRYAPSRASVRQAETWLRTQGFAIGALPSDRLFIPAQGSARQVERAFGTGLGYFQVDGHVVRLATGTLSVPTSLAGVASGVLGVNQYLETPTLARESHAPARTRVAKPSQEPAPPAGFRNPKPCSYYWGQQTDTADSTSLYSPYDGPLPYDICGYGPKQLRDAYSIAPLVDRGIDGSGVGIAIVDAYDSPTLLSDAQKYFEINNPNQPLLSSQFINVEPTTVDDEAECDGSGWYDEAALDVESSHSMAPGADILFVGAQDCLDTSLLAALQTAVTSGASVVSDSWGDDVGDLFDDVATHTAYDNTFLLADATGVSVLFSSGDSGDNFADFGLAAPDYPPSSPYVTAVGGTALEINSTGNREAEYGWSTGKETLCVSTSTSCGKATTPTGSLAFQSGGGGGTSYYYAEPYYQAPVVPAALALRNDAIFGPTPLRVVPDISMDADAQTGMLIGLTQTFPDGTYYGEFKEGGTSLASPLLAGVVADADQAAGVSLGFLNPALYKAYGTAGTFYDIKPPASPLSAAVIRVDYADEVDKTDGYAVSLRVLDYEGPETYCDGTDNCATRPVTLTTAKGYDSLTGLGSVGYSFVTNIAKL
jgi:subtilase family serine protease